ncbi:MAG: TetR/AcrR family transcriptional regulator [Ardenticatenaceae bacterium]|nr:TetR/AcrR family transcriptional regulator [Ardenticatenaceae bacterium]
MSTTIYVNHRESQREGILEAAEELFIQKGIEQVTIGKIAKEARLTRATIYKYFSNKEEIAKEIYTNMTEGWRERHEKEVWSFAGNGYQRLENFLLSFFAYLFQNPREARFISELNYLYAKHWSAESFIQTMRGNLQDDFDFVHESIQQGIEDGSLRADIEADVILAAFFNFLPGMINRFGGMGDKVQTEFGLNPETIFIQVCRIFLDGLKASSE